MINVTGSLQIKKNIYYAVFSFKQDGKWKTKWITTKIKAIKKNRKIAEDILQDLKIHFQSEINGNISTNNTSKVDILFIDFMKHWLKMIKPSLEETTYNGYERTINGRINTFFRDKNITLQDLKSDHIQDFYQYLIDNNLSCNTVKHYHANIRKALQYAIKINLISFNPADKVELPKVKPYVSKYYFQEEILQLFKVIKNTKLETPVLLACFYGLRRSEIVGLKWDAIDFKNKSITINHVVNQISAKIIEKDRTKTKSSTRTLPLLPELESYLLKLKEKRCLIARNFGYNNNFLDYICVDDNGNLLHPNYITQTFRKLLIKNNLKIIRFHDLRHSVASLLLNDGIDMKQIQVWLGHSSYNTTANIYAHLDTSSMKQSAYAISKLLTKVY